jgi:hypothetical protein
MIWFVTSDWPSVYNQRVEFVRSLVSQRWKSSYHIVLVKTGSMSLTIDTGTPWSLTIWSKNDLATIKAENGCPKVMN